MLTRLFNRSIVLNRKKTLSRFFILICFLLVESFALEDLDFENEEQKTIACGILNQNQLRMASTTTPIVNQTKMPTFYLSHGGGPCFFMDTDAPLFREMNSKSDARKWYESFSQYVPQKPKNILVVSAHWEEEPITITTKEKPSLYFDYYGFPPHTYKLQYNVPHDAQLVQRIKQLLGQSNIKVAEDNERGFDHGVFVPLILMYPEKEQIPVVQISIHPSLDPEFHFKMGQALAPLRSEGTLIIGSGSLTHNLGSIRGGENYSPSWVGDWINYVSDTFLNPKHTPEQRKQSLIEFKKQKSAIHAHPREEHWIPVYVAAGAAYDSQNFKVEQVYDKTVATLSLNSFKFTS